eukprot:CAMPEP_0185019614 /NCGR_PEP_ID=MMETSP1103-20130426/2237_1 /TAXON_ID=36769 /ORGANISM="Paraphysomonas bandaiensis, Strain Caron Lab Isolate" /LENGTH=100 /DNA_ID=CAMNT_0027550033 /DNA_START=30 /DNA_END=332 /DNA_ORIENTATION=+
MDTSLYSSADDTIKTAVCSRIRSVCPKASDQLIALVYTIVAQQCQVHKEYLFGLNAITPTPTLHHIQGDISALERSIHDLQRSMEEVQRTLSAILRRLPG